ncbi:MAG: DUF2092 domain-containing protein [Geminicoccaceae bacterium]
MTVSSTAFDRKGARLAVLLAAMLALAGVAQAQDSTAPAAAAPAAAPAEPAASAPAPAAPAEPATPPATAEAQTAPNQPPPAPPNLPVVFLPNKPELEPKAVDLLKAMSHKLASAKTLSFTSVAMYESPARTGQPLLYSVKSDVLVKRPNHLQIITLGDGPASEFYYDGKTVMAYTPGVELVAMADAPDTIDAMLKAAYHQAAIYFPFTDVLVADPWGDLKDDLKLAFYMGQSHVVGDTTTDIVVIASDTAQAQIWIGAKDHLPRMIRATFFDEPGNFRHTVEMSNWHLDGKLPKGAFTSAKAAKAKRIPFAPPGAF